VWSSVINIRIAMTNNRSIEGRRLNSAESLSRNHGLCVRQRCTWLLYNINGPGQAGTKGVMQR
jgi:hypothetical protein